MGGTRGATSCRSRLTSGASLSLSTSVPGPSSSHAGVGEPVPSECTSTRHRARTKVDGARRIWGTMNQTSMKTVENAISRFCKMDGLSIKRKTKTGSSKSSWWFVVHADKKVLCELENKWDEVHLHTSWMLQTCSKPDNNPTNGPENVQVNDCSASATIDQLESPPSSSPSTVVSLCLLTPILLMTHSVIQNILLQALNLLMPYLVNKMLPLNMLILFARFIKRQRHLIHNEQ